MDWSYVYLIIGALCFLAGGWRLSRGGSVLLPLVGILWFLVVLFQFFIPEVYRFNLIRGVPSAGRLIHYVIIPVVILILIAAGRRRI
jgi:hypothetical protein